MKIRIDGGVVVGWSGTGHEIIPDGSVVIENDRVQSVGTDKSQPVDKVIDASGTIVSPGFVNLHVHSQLNVGDYLLADVTRKDYLTANWFVFGAPLKEKLSPPPAPAVAIGRKYALFSALKNGATTILDPGGGRVHWMNMSRSSVSREDGFLARRTAALIFSPTRKAVTITKNVKTRAVQASRKRLSSSSNTTARITAGFKEY